MPIATPTASSNADRADEPPRRHATGDEAADIAALPPLDGGASETALQIDNTYIVTACDEGLMIVDQHAMHERLIYNDLRRRLTQGPLSGQRLLIPQTLRVSAAEADAAETHAPLLAKLGIELQPFGPDTLAVQLFPTLLSQRGVEIQPFLRDLLDKLIACPQSTDEQLLDELLEMLACKAAVKAGQPLSQQEIASLLHRRHQAEQGSSCPHGRPTTLKLTLKDLQKQFKRI